MIGPVVYASDLAGNPSAMVAYYWVSDWVVETVVGVSGDAVSAWAGAIVSWVSEVPSGWSEAVSEVVYEVAADWGAGI